MNGCYPQLFYGTLVLTYKNHKKVCQLLTCCLVAEQRSAWHLGGATSSLEECSEWCLLTRTRTGIATDKAARVLIVLMSCNCMFCAGVIHIVHAVFGVLCTKQLSNLMEEIHFKIHCKFYLNYAVWLYVLTFATTEAKGRHYSSKTNFFALKSWLVLLPSFFSPRSVFTVLIAVRFGEESSPEEKKVLFSLSYDFALVCSVHLYTCTHVAVCLLNLCLLSCMNLFPPVNSSILQSIYLII